jgi:hypothetical protein
MKGELRKSPNWHVLADAIKTSVTIKLIIADVIY